MLEVNVAEVKAKLSEYLDRVLAGERIVICRHNKPVAELRAITGARTDPRPIGPLPGRPPFEVPASFFEPLPPDEVARWEHSAPGDPLSAAAKSERRRTWNVAESSGQARPPRPRGARRRP